MTIRIYIFGLGFARRIKCRFQVFVLKEKVCQSFISWLVRRRSLWLLGGALKLKKLLCWRFAKLSGFIAHNYKNAWANFVCCGKKYKTTHSQKSQRVPFSIMETTFLVFTTFNEEWFVSLKAKLIKKYRRYKKYLRLKLNLRKTHGHFFYSRGWSF